MKFILGKKIGMTQRFDEQHQLVPVTLIQAGPCLVTQIKNSGTDGYQAVQLAFGHRSAKRIKKPQQGKLKALKIKINPRWFKEFKVDQPEKYQLGQEVKVDIFSAGELIKITGFSKGRGFQGVVKRHGFHGSPASHGHKDQLRMPGAIGSGGVGHVFKGTRMGGHMGDQQVTVQNLEIIEVIADKDLLLVKGATPGARNGLLLISTTGKVKKKKPVVEVEKETSKKKTAKTKEVKDAVAPKTKAKKTEDQGKE